MTFADVLARKRVDKSGPSSARSAQYDRPATQTAALLHLALFAALSVAVYYVTLVRPYGLQRLWMMHQFDLDRLSAADPAARWYILGGLIAEGLLYYMAWRALQNLRGSRAAWVIVIGGALASSVVLLFFYPIGSTDIWDYIVHGRMLGLYHANPFVHVAAQYPQDVFSWYAGWPYDTSAYGPLWEMMAAITARLAGSGVVQNVITFKALSAGFLAASVAAIGAILAQRSPERLLTGVFLLAWNPVVLYETLANGHNDIVMAFWILIAAYLLLGRHYTLAILALVAGALIKFIPLLMVPVAGLIALRDLPTWRARALFLLATTVAAVALIVAVYRPFWDGVQILSMARRQEMYTSSLPAAVVALRFPDMGWLAATKQISQLAGLLTAAYAVFEAFRAMADRSWTSFTRSAFNIMMFYLLVTCLWFWPWYAIWVLCLAPVLPPGHAARLAQVFGAAALSKPLIFVPLFGWHQPPLHDWVWQQLRLGPSVMALPWAFALYGLTLTSFRYLRDRFKAARLGTAAAGIPAYSVVGSGESRYPEHQRRDQ